MKKRMLALVLVCCLTAGQMVFAAEEVYPAETVPADGTVEMGENQTESPGEEETGKEESLQQSGPESSADNGETTPEAQEITIYIANASDPVTIDMTREEYEAGVSVEYQDMDVCNGYTSYYRDDEQKLYLEFSANMPGETDIKIWNSSRDRLYAYYHATAVYEEMNIYNQSSKRIETPLVLEDVSGEEWTLTTSDESVCTGNIVFEDEYDNSKRCILEFQAHSIGSTLIEVKYNGMLYYAYQVTVTELPDNVIVFPDKNLENELIMRGYDQDRDGYITKEELAEVEILYLSNCNLTDLTGLEWAVNLQEIYLYDNPKLENVDALFALENLEHFNLQHTNVSMRDRWELAKISDYIELYKSENFYLTERGYIFDEYPNVEIQQGTDVVEYNNGSFKALDAGDAVCIVDLESETKEIRIHVEGIPSNQATGATSDKDILQMNADILLDSSGKLWQLYPKVTSLKENLKSYVAGWIYSGTDAVQYRYDLDQDGILWDGDHAIASDVQKCKGHYILDNSYRLKDIYNTDSITIENVKDWYECVLYFEGQQEVYYTYVLKNDGTLWSRKEVEKDAEIQDFQQIAEGVRIITGTSFLKDNDLYYYSRYDGDPYITDVAEFVSDSDGGNWYIGTDGNTYISIWGRYMNIGSCDIQKFVFDMTAEGNRIYYLTEDGKLYQYKENADDLLVDEHVTELIQDRTYSTCIYKKADGLFRSCSEGKIGTEDAPVPINTYGFVMADYGVPGDYNLLRNGVELLTHVKNVIGTYAIRTDGTVWNVAKVPEKILDLDGGTYVRGDANGDGIVDISDLRMVLRKVCKKTEFDSTQMAAADVTDDGNVDIQDLRKILRFVCKKITEL